MKLKPQAMIKICQQSKLHSDASGSAVFLLPGSKGNRRGVLQINALKRCRRNSRALISANIAHTSQHVNIKFYPSHCALSDLTVL